MAKDSFGGWWETNWALWQLGMEASAVVAMRSAKLAAGGSPALAEANRMIAEKAQAAFEVQMGLMTGRFGSPDTATRRIVRHYTTKVRANRRRLGGS
ncbi:hypothetical protein [Sphingomonas sp. KR3-1]|uniref:hypothetical protein n=1 Tax=Sphingomonas sp. KR3-1 TaxID=3156611 RepID=UPI0032B42511